MSRNARTQGVHHVGLTVPDLGATRRFFTEALEFEPAGEVPDYPAVFVTDGSVMITLWQAENPVSAVPFDRRTNIGLHHLALRVESSDVLARLHDEISARKDVIVEFEPESLGGSDIQHMMIRIPGNIRLELIVA